MGRKPVAARLLRHVASTDGVAVVGVLSDSHLELSPTADVARELGLPLYSLEEAQERLRREELAFDLGLSVLYWRRIKGSLLTTPRYGIINFHPAPLPEYKGVGGYNLAILDKLDQWAVSAHYMDADIDTGPIISVDRFAIDPEGETAQSLEATSMNVLQELVLRVWADFMREPRRLATRPNSAGRYVSRSDLEQMKKIDFERDDVMRKVRAFWFPPYDGAYLEHDGERMTLVNRDILEKLADPASSSLFTARRKRSLVSEG